MLDASELEADIQTRILQVQERAVQWAIPKNRPIRQLEEIRKTGVDVPVVRQREIAVHSSTWALAKEYLGVTPTKETCCPFAAMTCHQPKTN